MKPKTVMLLAVAVGCGLIAMLGVQQVINARPRSAELETIRVLVALQDIEPGYPLQPEMVEFRNLPKAAVPADAVTELSQYEERSLLFAVTKDDVIRISKLSERGVSGRSLTIPYGYRVRGIAVDDTQTQSGLLRPGDLVDVMVTYETRTGRGQPMTQVKTLLEAITVFATDNQTANQAATNQGAKTKTVSLLVTPEQASYLALAERKGRLTLVWRNPLDDEILEYGGVNEALLEELRGTVGPGTSFPYYDLTDPEFQNLSPAYVNDAADRPEPILDHSQADPPPPPPMQVTDFLNQQGSGAAVSITPAITPEPDPVPTWTVTIYAGSNRHRTEFELPPESATTTSEPLHADAVSAEPSAEFLTSLTENTATELDPKDWAEELESVPEELEPNFLQEVLKGLLQAL